MIQYSIKSTDVINTFQSGFPGYGEDLKTIKRLMYKEKLGIMSEQLFKILINKYPAAYRLLLIEKEYQNKMSQQETEKDEKKEQPLSIKDAVNKQLIETEKEIYEKWIYHYGRP